MRNVIIGVVTGACFCVVVLAASGACDGYANPDHYPPGSFSGMPRPLAGCIWALAYFGLLAAQAGAFVGGILGAVATGIRYLTQYSRGQVARRARE
jgi:hypothetical protein